MNDTDKQKQWFKNLLQSNGDKKKKNSKLQYVAVVLFVGVALMLFGSFSKSTSPSEGMPVFKEEITKTDTISAFVNNKGEGHSDSMQDYEYQYEKQLKEALEQIAGVSEVSIMINLAETETQVFEKNSTVRQQNTDETDREGGTRKVEDLSRDDQVVIIRSGDKEEPLVVRTEKPTIRGVLVVANGVENIQVKTWVVEAVSRVLDVPSHRVSVLPKNPKGE
ncbi:MAG: stage III sporulation protein AG [Bacillaceae bacterium]|nr:stage III sporulation protein AG [Bacillaceae bacterium]